VQCPNCHAENAADSSYCNRCATPLSLAGADDWTRTRTTPLPAISTGMLVAGKYRVLEELGRGGMGVVYKAEDLRLKRAVALKFLPPHLTDSPELRRRFLVEAQAAAALSHPNICVIHEVGESEDRPYIAMEHVEGETLRERLRMGPLDPGEAAELAAQVAAGLAEAHARGIIHRDIKSSNVMVTGGGQAKIMDFGLAKLEGGPELTKSRITLGTVSYMSPEQAAGDEVDHRADLWSLGVVLYEMLTGGLPFPGHQNVPVLHAILHEEPRPMGTRPPPVPGELQQVVARALRKAPEARYVSAEAMLADLRRYEVARRAEAAGMFNFASMARLLRRPRVAVPAVATILVLALVGAWLAKRRAEVRWAREVALPEIERLIEANDAWRNLVLPYRLAEQAEAVLGDDPDLAALFERCSLRIDVRTEPHGARISMKEYGDADGEWTYLGLSPLAQVRVPVGIFRWRIEKEGYETVHAAASTWDVQGGPEVVAPYHLVRTLDEEGSLPPGTVRVPATETAVGPLGDFFIGRYEVTNREYKAFVDAGGYRKREYWKHPFVKDGREIGWEEGMRELVDRSGLPGPSTWMGGDYASGQDDHPVSGVSWYEAAAYAEYAGMRLPTSAHWNVARGGLTPMTRWVQLGGFAVLAPFSNFGRPGPVPVGSLSGITAYGAHDMAGNVREWCWNETLAGRAVRGGAWDDNTYEFGNLRKAVPMDRNAKNGFRLASYPDPESIPKAAFDPLRFEEPVNPRMREPVPEAVFQVYRDQFAYDPMPLNARVEDRRESPGGWIREKVSFDAAYGGERLLAYLFLPANTPPPYQTVVYFPGSAATWMRSSEDLESYYEFTMFLSFLVRNGRAVLFPVYKGTFERGGPEFVTLHGGAATRQYSEFLVQLVKDFRRSLDYLESRRDIDPGKLAFYGMSWGGWLGAIVPAVEERLAASVLVAGGLSERSTRFRPEADPLNYVTRVKTPTLILNGRYDTFYPPETSSEPLRDLLGTPAADKRLILYETDHIPPRAEYIKEILSWLDRYLGPVGSR
jgi:eukaryotic-like serine/threonine-protein kinase